MSDLAPPEEVRAADPGVQALPASPQEPPTSAPAVAGPPPAGPGRALPLALIVAGVALLALVLVLLLLAADRGTAQATAALRAQVQSLRLAAALGPPLAAGELKDSSAALAREVAALDSAALKPLADRVRLDVAAWLAAQPALAAARAPFEALAAAMPELAQAADSLVALRQQQGAAAAEVSALAGLARAAERIGPGARSVFGGEGADADAALRLEDELAALRDSAELLAGGRSDPRVPPLKDTPAWQRLQGLLEQIDTLHAQAAAPPQQALDAAALSARLRSDNAALRQALAALPASPGAGLRAEPLWLLGLAAAAVLAGAGLALLLRRAARERQGLVRRLDAQQQELLSSAAAHAAAETGHARLAAEWQALGDAGATLPPTVSDAASQAASEAASESASESARDPTREPATAPGESGQALRSLAGRLVEAAAQAQQGDLASRRALQAADAGAAVVRDAIETIQDLHGLVQGTGQRLQRLAESTQEIGEISGLLADITERTRVLSLNAAIQAASAGAAGRGFSAVAEEMQRLVLRTADAARRIAVLVELQQSDTLGASGAMERATEGVAESARQAAAAEAALAEIQHATRALTDQVAGGLVRASRDAEVAARLASTLHRAEAEPAQGDRR